MLISSSGAYDTNKNNPFDAVNPLGDYTIRTIPTGLESDQISFSHDHYDTNPVKKDIQVLLPLNILKSMEHRNEIKKLAEHFYKLYGVSA